MQHLHQKENNPFISILHALIKIETYTNIEIFEEEKIAVSAMQYQMLNHTDNTRK